MIHARFVYKFILAPVLILSFLGTFATAAPAQAAADGSGPAVSLGAPPYGGTAFLDPDILTSTDPSVFLKYVYIGRGYRNMYDRRTDSINRVYAYLFRVTYTDGSLIEADVNPEFGSATAAAVEAQKYGWMIGQLPAVLRQNIKMLWIHMGNADFGGAQNAIVIHTGRAASYGNYIEEILIHESAHTSLDPDHAANSTWLLAQSLDGGFISDYASQYPTREDVAESFLTFLAVRYKLDRIAGADAATIQQTIPWRLEYFDNQHFDMTPVASSMTFSSRDTEDGWILESTNSSAVGGSMNSTASTLRMGDDLSARQYRSILSFDTSALPDNAVITRITLNIRPAAPSGNIITLFQGIMIDFRAGTFGAPALELADFDTPGDGTVADSYPSLVHGWYPVNLSDADSSINTAGLTQLRLRFQLDSNGLGANILSFNSGDAVSSTRPQLIVQYYIP